MSYAGKLVYKNAFAVVVGDELLDNETFHMVNRIEESDTHVKFHVHVLDNNPHHTEKKTIEFKKNDIVATTEW